MAHLEGQNSPKICGDRGKTPPQMESRTEGPEKGLTDQIKRPWYKDGLRFECQNCGICCSAFTASNGHVYDCILLHDADAAHMFRAHGGSLSFEDFLKKYTMPLRGYMSIIKMIDGKCSLMSDNKCSVHSGKPIQCASWPFWSSLLRDKETWENSELLGRCPGVGKGKLWSQEEIESVLNYHMTIT